MNKIKFYLTSILSILLSACISNAWTGANMIYDRHHLYKKSNDIKLSAKVGHALKIDPELNCPSNKCFEIAVFHGDVLLLGIVPSTVEKDRATQDIQAVSGYRHLYNYLTIDPHSEYPAQLQDHWITTQIRSNILANADIDPDPFKVVSHENIVYLMGDIMDDQEKLVIDVCRQTPYVNKVVNLMQAYTLQNHPRNIPASPTPQLPNTQAW